MHTDCDNVAVILTVHVPAYQLEEDGRILNVGDRVEFVYRKDEWRNEDGQARYEEVTASYLPTKDFGPIDPEVEQAAIREALERRAASGNPLRNGESVVVGVSIQRDVSVGSTETNWTGVLIDLELTGLVDA